VVLAALHVLVSPAILNGVDDHLTLIQGQPLGLGADIEDRADAFDSARVRDRKVVRHHVYSIRDLDLFVNGGGLSRSREGVCFSTHFSA